MLPRGPLILVQTLKKLKAIHGFARPGFSCKGSKRVAQQLNNNNNLNYPMTLALVPAHVRTVMEESLSSEGKAPGSWVDLVQDRRTDFYFRCLVRPLVDFFNAPSGTECVLFLGIKDPQPDVHRPPLTMAQRIVGVRGATQPRVEEELRWILTNLVVGDVSMDDIVVELAPTRNPVAPVVRIYIRSVIDRDQQLNCVAYVENDGTLQTALRANRLEAERRGEMDPETIRFTLDSHDMEWVRGCCHNPVGLLEVAPHLVAQGDVRLDQSDCQAFRRGNCLASAQCTLRHCEAAYDCIMECQAFRAGACQGCALLHTGAPVPGAVRRQRGGRRHKGRK